MSQTRIAPMPSGAFVEHMRESTQYAIHELSSTRVHASMVLSDVHHQPFGRVHGGVYAFGVNNSTDFLRPMTAGRVDVVAEPIFQGRTQQLWAIEIRRDSDGKLVARGQLRLHNLPLP